MYCWNCGAQVPDDAKFCKKCGARQDEIPESIPEKIIKPKNTGGIKFPRRSGTDKVRLRKSGLILLIAGVLLAAGCGGWVLYSLLHTEYPLTSAAHGEDVNTPLKNGKTSIYITKYGRAGDVSEMDYKLHTNDVNEFIARYSDFSVQTILEYDDDSNALTGSFERVSFSYWGSGISYIDDYTVTHKEADVIKTIYNRKGLPESEEYLAYTSDYNEAAPIIQIEKKGSGIVAKSFNSDGVLTDESSYNKSGQVTEQITYSNSTPLIRQTYEYSGQYIKKYTCYVRNDESGDMDVTSKITYTSKKESGGMTVITGKKEDGTTVNISYYKDGKLMQIINRYSGYDELTDYIYEDGLLIRKEVFYTLNNIRQYLIGVTTYSYR